MTRARAPLLCGLILLCLALATLGAECALRFTDYRYLTGYGDLHENRGYAYADDKAGVDIVPNYPKRTVNIEPGCRQEWSNEIGCFDEPYRGEKEYCLLLGDSFAYGIAPFEATFGKVLDDVMGVRVMKCGVCGYGPRQELIKAEKTVALLGTRPRVIIVAYYIGNDLLDDCEFPSTTVINGFPVRVNVLDVKTGKVAHRDIKELRRSADRLEKARVATINLMDEEVKSDLPNRVKKWLRNHSVLHNLLILTFKKYVLRMQKVREAGSVLPVQYMATEARPWLAHAWERHLENLAALHAFARRNASTLLVVIIPEKQQVYRSLRQYPGADYLFPNRVLGQFFEKRGIAYIDLLPFFQEHARPAPGIMLDAEKDLYWRFDLHLNVKGNRLAALDVARYMIERGLVDVGDREGRLRAITQELSAFR